MAYFFYPQRNPNTPQTAADERRRQIQQQFAQQILGQQATTADGGLGQLAAGLALWRQRQQEAPENQFPTAPGGAQPSFLTGLGNLFTGNNNGGLY